MKDLAQVLMEHYRFWYHDQMDATSQVRPCMLGSNRINPPLRFIKS